MFCVSQTCQICRLDWSFLENPSELANLILSKTSCRILVNGGGQSSATYRAQLSADLRDRIYLVAEVASSAELRGYFPSIPGLFNEVFFTSDQERVSIANESSIGTILIRANPTVDDARSGCDLVASVETLGALFENGFYGGLLGEIVTFPAKQFLPGHPGGHNRTMRVFFYGFSTAHETIPRSYSAGRYLRKNDQLMKRHHYTRFLKQAKNFPDVFAPALGSIVDFGFKKICELESLRNPILTFVPKKPSDAFDKNRLLLGKVSGAIPLEALLGCPQDFPKQKDVGSYEARAENVRGKFRVARRLRGNEVVLFDDLYTSGSTLSECARVLIAAGATRVIPMTLALACHESLANTPPLICSHCQGALEIRFKKNQVQAFWGCVNWKPNQNHTALDFSAGLQRLVRLQREIDDENFPF